MKNKLPTQSVTRRNLPWGEIYVFLESEEFDVSVVVVHPHSQIDPYYHKQFQELICILEGEGEAVEGIVKAGDLFVLRSQRYFSLKNRTDKPLGFLRVGVPPYDFDDVVIVKVSRQEIA